MTEAFDKQTGASPVADKEAAEVRLRENGAIPGPAVRPGNTADEPVEADEVTGASPGTAKACSELGLNSLEANLSRFNIKPPGVR